MNTNAIHNILNVGIAGATAALVASGCVATAAGGLDCTNSWINPTYTAWAIGAMAIGKIAMNILRDGVTGLWKPQPPVQK